MTEKQKTIGALAVLAAAIGVYAEINYQAKMRAAETSRATTGAALTPSASSSSTAAPKK